MTSYQRMAKVLSEKLTDHEFRQLLILMDEDVNNLLLHYLNGIGAQKFPKMFIVLKELIKEEEKNESKKNQKSNKKKL